MQHIDPCAFCSTSLSQLRGVYSLPQLLVKLVLVREASAGGRSHVQVSPVNSSSSSSPKVAPIHSELRCIVDLSRAREKVEVVAGEKAEGLGRGPPGAPPGCCPRVDGGTSRPAAAAVVSVRLCAR